MDKKGSIRVKYLIKRKKNYFNTKSNFFNPLIKLLKKKNKVKKNFISIYYPTNHELNILDITNIEFFKNSDFLLPAIEDDGKMYFYRWKKNDVLYVNRFGILEPKKTTIIYPDIIFVPILAFDNKKNRLGYGKGFYDKFLNECIKIKKKFLTIGVAFSFQKYNNLPINKKDIRLDYIITEKGII